MSGSMSGVWKQGHGRTSEAPPDERGGNGYVRPATTAPHLDSTNRVDSARVQPQKTFRRLARLGRLAGQGGAGRGRELKFH